MPVPVIGRYVDRRPVVAVVPLTGVIGAMGGLRRGLHLRGVADVLDRAFRLRRLKAVALVINSPGGSAVQSALIANRIRALAAERDVPVLAFTEDVAASGGYWLACAADEIFADENSIIGSIGVISAGFGLTGLIDKLGVERRVHTAGERKLMLDPFQAENPDDVARLEALQGDIHEAFKRTVRDRRGRRLAADEDVLFTGEFWTGRRALDLGLVDGLGDLRTVMRERFGDKVRLCPVGARRPWWKRMGPLAALAGGADTAAPEGDWARAALSVLEERLFWNRFGL